MQVEITFRSGAQVTFDAEEITINKNGLGAVTGLSWTTPERYARRLLRVDPGEIAAIVRVGDDGEEAEEKETADG